MCSPAVHHTWTLTRVHHFVCSSFVPHTCSLYLIRAPHTPSIRVPDWVVGQSGEPGLPSIRDLGDIFDPERASAGASQVSLSLSLSHG